MTTEEVGQMLSEWVIVTRDRDARARAAARITKHRVDQLTGIGRSTIDLMLASPAPGGPSIGTAGGRNDH